MSKHRLTFVGACLKGDAFLADIDDWVDDWHDTDFPDDEPSLYEFLGFTEEEGKLWVERPESLGAIVAAHRLHQPVEAILQSQDSYASAARSVSPEDAEKVLGWLIERGRIGPKAS